MGETGRGFLKKNNIIRLRDVQPRFNRFGLWHVDLLLEKLDDK